MNRLQVFAQNNFPGRAVDFWIKDGEESFVTDLVAKRIDSGAPTPPAFSLSETEAQALMDRLWSCGFRPSEGTGSAGAFNAVQKHLADMRTIAFNFLKVEKPDDKPRSGYC